MGQAESDAPVAIVTGGAKGIGAAVTRRLSEDGFTVAVFDVDANAGEKLVASLSARDASSHLCDVSSYESVWDRLIGINLRGPIHLCHAVLPHMVSRGRGAVVNVASDAGRVGSSGETVYAACKGGVTAFTKSVAREMARHGIRANCVCPGPTDTPLSRRSDRKRPVTGSSTPSSEPRRSAAWPRPKTSRERSRSSPPPIAPSSPDRSSRSPVA